VVDGGVEVGEHPHQLVHRLLDVNSSVSRLRRNDASHVAACHLLLREEGHHVGLELLLEHLVQRVEQPAVDRQLRHLTNEQTG